MLATIFNQIFRNLSGYLRHAPSRAVGVIFALDSFLFGCWVSRIPIIKSTLGLDEGELGFALFGAPVGLLMMNPVAGWITNRLGAGRASILFTVLMAAALPLPLTMTGKWTLFGALVLYGGIISVLNIAMNAAAALIEKHESRTIMSTCHGMWSIGGVLGSTLSGILIGLQVTSLQHAFLGVSLVFLALLAVWSDLSPIREAVGEGEKSSFVRPTPMLLLMIVLGLFAAMGEGIAFDWSGVYLKDYKAAPDHIAALGFATFTAGMTIGRFSGDTILPIFGTKRLLTLCYLVAGAALGLCIAAPTPPVALLGYFLLGLGCSLVAPVLFGASMRLDGVTPAAGLATYSTFSFIGFLAGPPLIGYIGKASSLHWGLAFVGILLLIGSVLVQRLRL